MAVSDESSSYDPCVENLDKRLEVGIDRDELLFLYLAVLMCFSGCRPE